MKKLIVLALALVISTAGILATNLDDPVTPKKQIRNQIVKFLEDPSFTIDREINVVLTFTFNSEGEIVVLCAGCKDKKIVNYIRKNLNNKKFLYPGVQDKIYKMPLKVKVA